MKTGTLKIVTGTFIALSLLILLGWPIIVGPRPKGKASARTYLTRGLGAISALTVFIVVSGVSSVLLVRRTREEVREESLQNIKVLIEGMREDQSRKAKEPDDA